MSHSTKKPKHEFFTACGNGQWRVVRNGKPYYFGSWRDDPRGEAAIQDWHARKDAILAGIDAGHHNPSPTANTNGMLVTDLVLKYLGDRSKDVEAKNLTPDTFKDYAYILNDFAATLPPKAKAVAALRPKFADYLRIMEQRGMGPHAIKRHVTVLRMAFNYAAEEGWCDAIAFGRSFRAPNTESEAVAMWHAKRDEDAKTEIILTRRQIRKFLRRTKLIPKWRVMGLLLLNTAMNPAELARLRWDEINWQTGRLRRRRWKTGIWQECYLWKITRDALKFTVNTSDLVFTRKNGKPLVGSEPIFGENMKDVVTSVKRWNKIIHPFARLCKAMGLDGVTPYTFRRTSRTIAAHNKDDNAARRMMGQRLTGQDQTYIKRPFPMSRLHPLSMTIYTRIFNRPPPKIRLASDKAA